LSRILRLSIADQIREQATHHSAGASKIEFADIIVEV
jgi:hypothetical protein